LAKNPKDPPNREPRAESEHDRERLVAERRAKLKALREQGFAYPNDFARAHLAADLHSRAGNEEHAALEANPETVRVAGRIMLKRVMGKASFATIRDGSGAIQIFVSDSDTGESEHAAFKHHDIGDIIGVEGELFRTRTGELTVRARKLKLLAKSLRPLPEKWRGLTDQELRYRQRYVDLIVNEDTRRVFQMRSSIVHAIRDFLLSEQFLEVETPMMQPIPGRARSRSLPAHRARALSQAAGGGRTGEGVRDQPQLPERRHLHEAQPRVHDARVLRGLHRLRVHDVRDPAHATARCAVGARRAPLHLSGA
jgi:lysyl-tRNA synthetase class 2